MALPVTQQVRSFSRFYTNFLGLLNNQILDSPLSLSESRILYELAKNEGTTSNQLVATLSIDKGYLSRILKKFEKEKLLLKVPSVQDKRVRILSLSAKGEKIFRHINEKSEQQVAERIGHLTEDAKHELGTILQKTERLLDTQRAQPITLEDIVIRTDLRPGDVGFVIMAHGELYQKEYQYGINFETYVAKGMAEFYERYDPDRSRVWVCEHLGRRVGFLLLMARGNAAQLRYFFLSPEYRGVGLGKKLMQLYMDFLREKGYLSSYLWTTHELFTAASLYKRAGFKLVEEMPSNAFGKVLTEQKYELIL
ncbi:bifunctional helix-turn-helix transcriptional regulator/GNAT family N-acetyltransferase [Salmonirosea aquatica]